MPTQIDTSVKAVSFTPAKDAKKVFGAERKIEAITIHHWGVLGQNYDAVLRFFANDEDDDFTSAHYVVMGGRINQIVADEDVAWHAGNRTANLTTLGLELRPEATDEDYTTAAELIAALRAVHGDLPLYPHKHWKATNCPGVWDLERLDKLARGKKETEMSTKFSSPLPVGVYRTDGFDGLGKSREHMGVDWAGPHVGDKTPVYAVADGVVEATGGPGTGAVLPGHSGYLVLLDHGILTDKNGSDHIRTNYNHLSKIMVKKGQRVKAGQQIGVTGATGNVTGVHLHFGVRQGAVSFRNYFDGEAWLKRKGITVGKTAPLTVSQGGSVTPVASKPAKPSQGKPAASKGNSKADNTRIQKALTKMGIHVGVADGVDGNLQKRGVKQFQKAHGLVQDGVWGPRTQAKYEDNVAIQTALKKQGYTKQVIDGYRGAQTKANLKDFGRRTGTSGAALRKKLGV